MFHFKKVILGFAALMLASCSSNGDRLNHWMKENGKLKILSTTAQIGDLCSEIGGDRVDCWVLIQGNLDPHSYELVKGDDEKISRADLIFYNGLGLEHGASLSSALRNNEQGIAVAEKIAALAPERILKRGAVIDPHLWMDVSLWEKGIGPIVERLSASDPAGATYYEERGEILLEKMKKTHQEIQETLNRVPKDKKFLVTSHDAFQYFAQGYLSGSTAPEGLAPDGQLNPVDLRRIIDFLIQHRISVLFPETNVSRDSIVKIVSAGREMGYELRLCSEPLYGDAMGEGSYLATMLRNADVIARHLGSEEMRQEKAGNP